MRRWISAGLLSVLCGCQTGAHRATSASPDASLANDAAGAAQSDASLEASPSGQAPPQSYALSVTSVDHTFVTEDHFMASVEMQLSGEPFATAMGRDISHYSRNYFCDGGVCQAGTYPDPSADGGDAGTMPDLAGFSSAVESYEYSKQPMNNLAFESGAGTSLLFGSVLNPTHSTGQAALALAQTWFQHMAGDSLAAARFILPLDPESNPLGWPGLWPILQPFTSWDPTISPTNAVTTCSLTSDDNTGRAALLSNDYECNYNSLHLPNRAGQTTPQIGPGASGWMDWKEALWTLNYLQSMHDDHQIAVTKVLPIQLDKVGTPGNPVQGGTLYPGVYLGSSNIEGFQAGNFIQALDNQAAQWLLELSTTDGAALSGFASLADALAYNASSPLCWFPTAINVTETSDASGFPRPASYAVSSSDSVLLDLAGLLGAYATTYTLTDTGNLTVGGTQSAAAYFDGDPFPVQPQIPSGQATLHDRALAMVRVLVVNLDRLHLDPATSTFVDRVTFAGATPSRGHVLSADVAAYTLLSLRTARSALASQLDLYGNTRPDTQGVPLPLDAFPLSDDTSFGQRLGVLIQALADTLQTKLTSEDGTAFAGWDVTANTPTDSGTSLDAHTAAIRGLLVAYLATGSVKYRDRALAVFERLDRTFYDPSARIYRPTAGDPSLQVTFTPRRFGLLQGALRDTYELVALLPGNEPLTSLIEDRVGRLNKLVLNGWDDRNQDGLVDYPAECAQIGTGPDGAPLGLGGLQMAERSLSGETGATPPDADGGITLVSDREHDCVPNIAAVGLPSALASAITFSLHPLPLAPDAGSAGQ
jgi:hypothetical protein